MWLIQTWRMHTLVTSSTKPDQIKDMRIVVTVMMMTI